MRKNEPQGSDNSAGPGVPLIVNSPQPSSGKEVLPATHHRLPMRPMPNPCVPVTEGSGKTPLEPQPQPSEKLKERAREFLKSWSHEPTPIPANATIGSGLWYSTACTEEVLAAFASSIQEGERQQIEELTLERDYAKANWDRVGKKYKAERERAESAEQQLAEARVQGMREAAEKFESECGDHCNNWCWHKKAAETLRKMAESRAGRDLEGK